MGWSEGTFRQRQSHKADMPKIPDNKLVGFFYRQIGPSVSDYQAQDVGSKRPQFPTSSSLPPLSEPMPAVVEPMPASLKAGNTQQSTFNSSAALPSGPSKEADSMLCKCPEIPCHVYIELRLQGVWKYFCLTYVLFEVILCCVAYQANTCLLPS